MNLIEFLTGHNVNSIYTKEEIVLWLDKYPVLKSTQNHQSEFEWVILSLSFDSQSKLFAIRDVPLWYSKLADMIAKEEDVIIQSLGANDIERRAKIKFSCGLFVRDLNEIGKNDLTMQQLITFLLTYFPESFETLLILLVASNVITEIEMLRLALVELKPQQKRWQSLGLELPPSIENLPV